MVQTNPKWPRRVSRQQGKGRQRPEVHRLVRTDPGQTLSHQMMVQSSGRWSKWGDKKRSPCNESNSSSCQELILSLGSTSYKWLAPKGCICSWNSLAKLKLEFWTHDPNSQESSCQVQAPAPKRQIKRHDEGRERRFTARLRIHVGKGRVSTQLIFSHSPRCQLSLLFDAIIGQVIIMHGQHYRAQERQHL
jgi:hypothetical protein